MVAGVDYLKADYVALILSVGLELIAATLFEFFRGKRNYKTVSKDGLE